VAKIRSMTSGDGRGMGGRKDGFTMTGQSGVGVVVPEGSADQPLLSISSLGENHSAHGELSRFTLLTASGPVAETPRFRRVRGIGTGFCNRLKARESALSASLRSVSHPCHPGRAFASSCRDVCSSVDEYSLFPVSCRFTSYVSQSPPISLVYNLP